MAGGRLPQLCRNLQSTENNHNHLNIIHLALAIMANEYNFICKKSAKFLPLTTDSPDTGDRWGIALLLI